MASTLNPGDIAITINGKEHVLKPTLRALDAVSAHFNGLAHARAGLMAQDFNAVTNILRHALNLTVAQFNTMREDVFAHGLDETLLVPLMHYVGTLANGGKPPPNLPVEDTSAAGNV